MIRRGAAALAATAAVGGSLLLPLPARAAEGCDGVLVVVETRSVPDRPGYGSRTGCSDAPRSGIQALQQAGFSVKLGTGPYAGGFVCALDGAPKAGCGAVTKDHYWSYWYMLPGTSTWVYSQLGAGNRVPPRGSIEGWVWQDGGGSEPPSPRSAKDPARPATPTPPSATTRPPSGGGGGGATSAPRPTGPASADSGDTAGGAVGGASPTGAGPAATAASPSNPPGAESAVPSAPASGPASAGAGASSNTSTAAPGSSRADAGKPAGHGAGAWLPVALGTAAVAALAGAAAWRRRRAPRAGDLP